MMPAIDSSAHPNGGECVIPSSCSSATWASSSSSLGRLMGGGIGTATGQIDPQELLDVVVADAGM